MGRRYNAAMDSKFSFDRGLLIPIGVGIFSIIGICLAFLSVYLDRQQAPAPQEPTVTPFKYLLLATETPLLNLEKIELVATEAIPTQEPTDTPSIESSAPASPLPPVTPVRTSTPPSSNSTQQNPTPTRNVTPTSNTGTQNVSDRYDDTDPRLELDGDWNIDTNVNNAYQHTLSTSSSIGNDVIFTFTGTQIVIGYIGGANLGTATVWIDGDEFEMDQSTGTQWVSAEFSNDEHFVLIIHDAGDFINLDYINVVGSN